ncbi:MAG TPA: hypothetical protein VKX17_20055 [Planctomycetota bacterium]|nr:hypothetical protein [Planctomycetota bacterium]
MRNSKWYVWAIAIAMPIAAALLALFWQKPESTNNPLGSTAFSQPANDVSNERANVTDLRQVNVVPKNMPVVTGFIGDLLTRGFRQSDGTVEPFVVGDSIKLEAEALNAVEYCWKLNGEVIKEKGQDWSTVPDRTIDLTKPGKYDFVLQVRGASPDQLSQPKPTGLTILPLKILKLSKWIIHDDDEHFLTGDTMYLQTDMVIPLAYDPDFYQFRYFVNDTPIKNADDGEEWTSSDTLDYVFRTPGTYSFKVEARRSTEKQAEEMMELPETVVAADAVLLSFDSFPGNDKGAAVGSQVDFNSFPYSRGGKSECRFGVKKINVANYAWLADPSGAIWGEANRTWVPTEAGTYLVRCEIREVGKEAADDFREMYFTVTDDNF